MPEVANGNAPWVSFRIFGVSYLPTNGIAGNGRESAVPQPAENVFRGLDPRVLRVRVVRIGLFLSVGHNRVPLFGYPDTDKQDVTLLKSDVVLLGDLQDVRETHLMGRECAILDSPFVGPRRVVDQDSTSYRPTFSMCRK